MRLSSGPGASENDAAIPTPIPNKEDGGPPSVKEPHRGEQGSPRWNWGSLFLFEFLGYRGGSPLRSVVIYIPDGET